MRGGRGEGERGGDLVSRGQHDHPFTTTSSHPRGQHDKSPASQEGEGEEGGRGMITTLFHAASTVTSTRGQRPVTRGGRGEGEGGGRSPATHAALAGGMITTLFHAASTTTSSHAPQRVRWGKGEGRRGGITTLFASTISHSLCKGEKGGMTTTLFHAASVTTSSHRPRNG